MQPLPNGSVLVRTWFGGGAAWERLVSQAEAPTAEGFVANVTCVDDRAYSGLTAEGLVELHADRANVSFIADERTLTDPESPILAVLVSRFDFGVEASQLRPFRVIPSELWSVEVNIDIANMDWWDFTENTDDDGVFRGFEP